MRRQNLPIQGVQSLVRKAPPFGEETRVQPEFGKKKKNSFRTRDVNLNIENLNFY